MTTPVENQAVEPTAITPASLPAPKGYRFGRAVVIALMVGPALVLLASLVFIVLDIFGHPVGG